MWVAAFSQKPLTSGADLVGKVEAGIPEDDPRNPAVIADNVGDNVGDVAGMGADLFGSCAESTCAAMVISAVAFSGMVDALLYPILISAIGIPVSFLTLMMIKVNSEDQVGPALKKMLIISSALMAVVMLFVTKIHASRIPLRLAGRRIPIWGCIFAS